MTIEALPWRTSSYSLGSGGNCVEIAESENTVKIRDSKQPDLAVLLFDAAEWRAFIAEVDQL